MTRPSWCWGAPCGGACMADALRGAAPRSAHSAAGPRAPWAAAGRPHARPRPLGRELAAAPSVYGLVARSRRPPRAQADRMGREMGLDGGLRRWKGSVNSVQWLSSARARPRGPRSPRRCRPARRRPPPAAVRAARPPHAHPSREPLSGRRPSASPPLQRRRPAGYRGGRMCTAGRPGRRTAPRRRRAPRGPFTLRAAAPAAATARCGGSPSAAPQTPAAAAPRGPRPGLERGASRQRGAGDRRGRRGAGGCARREASPTAFLTSSPPSPAQRHAHRRLSGSLRPPHP
jgi:hypothetical protein